MVQKKQLVQTHGPRVDHNKTENLFQHQDMKKKMKKSGSIKRLKKPPPPPHVVDHRNSASAPPRTTPNYMKSTSSSDARKSPDGSSLRRKSSEKATKTLARSLTKNPSFKPARKCSSVVLCEDLDAGRATCSSTLKDCKFPQYLTLNHGGTEPVGTSKIKVCPYTYCSLNGHALLPPLKCFLSARRRIIKTQKTKKTISPLENNDFFIEIYSLKNENNLPFGDEERVVEMLSDGPLFDDFDTFEENKHVLESTPSVCFNDSEGSALEWETVDHTALCYDHGDEYEYSTETFVEPDPEADIVENRIIISSDDELMIESDGKVDGFFMDEVSQESFDGFSSSDDSESTDSYDNLQIDLPIGNQGVDEEETTSFDNRDQESPPNEDATSVISDQVSKQENSDDNIITFIDQGNEHRSDGAQLGSAEAIFNIVGAENIANPEMEDNSSLARVTAKSKKKPIQESDELGSFNPRAPNFLPLEPDPEAEKVDLKHQDLNERKNTEEWMVDYALRQVVTKLGPVRKRKVALLVEAFEKVIPITNWDLHSRHSSTFDQARPIQACS